MLYAIITSEADDGLTRRAPARPAHLDYVKTLLEEGRLVVAGPHPAIDSPEPGQAGYAGSLIIAEFDSLEDAEAWAKEDPYVAAGVYAQVTVKPFIQVLP